MIQPADQIAEADWDRVVTHAPVGQFWNLSGWRRYSMAYAGPGAEDHSFGVITADGLAAVCTLIWEPQHKAFTLGGDPGPMPAFWRGEALREALAHAAGCAKAKETGLTFRMPAGRSGAYPAKEFGWIEGGWTSRCISLGYASAVLWRGMRKSYHALVHRTERTHRLVLSVSDALMPDYQALHKATVGTVLPRPDETYALQGQWLREGRALLLGAQARDTDQWDGFVYLFLHHDLAYYGSGPSRGISGVMHGLHWAAIRECAARRLLTYEMGWQQHAQDEKGKGIEMFKRGFGGQDVPLVTWTSP